MRIPQTTRRIRAGAAFAGILGVAALLQIFNANPAASQTLTLTAFTASEDPGMKADSPVWSHTSLVRVPLTAQAGTYVTGGGSIPTVDAKAVHFKDRLYIRVEWQDATADESTARAEDFSDAVALEFPSQAGAAVPSICMGQQGAGVNIWHWRADSQAGLKDPAEVFTSAQTDTTLATEPLFYTAREAGNPYANPELGPVQTLVAYAFGTLAPATVQDVVGEGMRIGNNRWAVVFSRPYASSGVDQAIFSDGQRTDMAIAVWNGSEGDRNGQKSVSQFITLAITSTGLPGGGGSNTVAGLLAVVVFVGLTAIGIGLATYGYREGRRP